MVERSRRPLVHRAAAAVGAVVEGAAVAAAAVVGAGSEGGRLPVAPARCPGCNTGCSRLPTQRRSRPRPACLNIEGAQKRPMYHHVSALKV